MITSSLCRSYVQECLSGVHRDTDTYKVALYTSDASLDASTTAYTTAHEVTGIGYEAGGMALSGFTTGLSGSVATVSWDEPVWPVASLTARGCLVYNATRANRAVAVVNFGGDVQSTDAPFTVQFVEGCVVRIILRGTS